MIIVLLSACPGSAGTTRWVVEKCQRHYARIELAVQLHGVDDRAGTMDSILLAEIEKLKTGALRTPNDRKLDAQLAEKFRRANPTVAFQVEKALPAETSSQVRDFILGQTDGLEKLNGTQIREYASLIQQPAFAKVLELSRGRIRFTDKIDGALGTYMPTLPIPFQSLILRGTPEREIQIDITKPGWVSTLAHELGHRMDFQLIQQKMPALARRIEELYKKRFDSKELFHVDPDTYYYGTSEEHRFAGSGQKRIQHAWLNPTEFWGHGVGWYFEKPKSIAERIAMYRNGELKGRYGMGHQFSEELQADSRESAIRILRERLAIGQRRREMDRARYRDYAVDAPDPVTVEKNMLEIYDAIHQDHESLRGRDPEFFNLLESVFGDPGFAAQR